MSDLKMPDDDGGTEWRDNLPLQPVNEEQKSSCIGPIALVLVGISVGSILLVGNSQSGCLGATQSSKLNWQARQSEIDAAEKAHQSIHQSSEPNGKTIDPQQS
jgi:hypothetical protein